MHSLRAAFAVSFVALLASIAVFFAVNFSQYVVSLPDVNGTVLSSSTVSGSGGPLLFDETTVADVDATEEEGPFSFIDTADQDVRELGYSLDELRSQGVEVLAHDGSIPRRCATGTSGGFYTQGMAIRVNTRYIPCDDGTSPLYDAYRPAGYTCAVVYNASPSSRSLAVLAHEIGHCLHFTYGEYGAFDDDFRAIRGIAVSDLGRHQMNEIIADDFMICRHGLDTDFGASSYYNRYDVPRPTVNQCTQFNDIVSAYLIR